MDFSDSEKLPSWLPKKLRKHQHDGLELVGNIIPSRHDAEPLDVCEVDGRGLGVLASSVCRLELIPGNEDGGACRCRIGRRSDKVIFIRDGRLLSASIGVRRQELVFDIERVLCGWCT